MKVKKKQKRKDEQYVKNEVQMASESTGEGKKPQEKQKGNGCCNGKLMFLGSECSGSVHAVSDGDPRYHQVDTILDTGATSNVMSSSEVPSVPIEDSPGSLAGQIFTSASGGKMPNQGQKRFTFETTEGDTFGITYQIADVANGLTSVGAVCDSGDGGNFVVFTKTGGYIASPQLGTTTSFSRAGRGAPYLLSHWIPKDNQPEPAPFGRRG